MSMLPQAENVFIRKMHEKKFLARSALSPTTAWVKINIDHEHAQCESLCEKFMKKACPIGVFLDCLERTAVSRKLTLLFYRGRYYHCF